MIKRLCAALAALSLLTSCATQLSTHAAQAGSLGRPVSTEQMLEALQRPGIVTFETVISADWQFEEDSATPGVDPPDWVNAPLDAQVFFYKARHPTRGLVMIDAGLPENTVSLLGPIIRNVFKIEETFRLRTSTATALAGEAPSAVLLTHLHWDHVLGVRELPRGTPLYVGPGEGRQSHFLLRFIAPITRRALEGRPPLNEWAFEPSSSGELSIVDVFGDGSLFAVHVPGHTPGSTAYVVNAVDGVHFITGDAIHSCASWSGQRVEPIGFTSERAQAWETLARLRALAARIPGAIVHPGHQAFNGEGLDCLP